MRKELHNTKVTVRLRKSAYRNEWYLYIESYPVYTAGKSEPQRVREYLNRIVTTVVWDKTRTARTTSSSKSYKPKRELNGVIQCKSEVDQEACIYADEVRKLRQREYDNADLYSDAVRHKRSKRNVYNKISSLIFGRRCISDTKIAPLLFLSIGRELWIFLKCMREKICHFSKSTILLQRNTNVSF